MAVACPAGCWMASSRLQSKNILLRAHSGDRFVVVVVVVLWDGTSVRSRRME